ncbi:hypothetical protein ACCO45_003809 [Purpureocillium lilacinum]|uniref:Uncharacterized protein n=1 Tax=Purpureocillium lilacinum TaxID=33203 RepID=A0ACC4E1A5_PURLI
MGFGRHGLGRMLRRLAPAPTAAPLVLALALWAATRSTERSPCPNQEDPSPAAGQCPALHVGFGRHMDPRMMDRWQSQSAGVSSDVAALS